MAFKTDEIIYLCKFIYAYYFSPNYSMHLNRLLSASFELYLVVAVWQQQKQKENPGE